MAVENAYKRQIKNRNFLAPTGFKLVLNRSPKVAFFSNAANLPGITLGEAIQPTYLKDIPTPGDKNNPPNGKIWDEEHGHFHDKQ